MDKRYNPSHVEDKIYKTWMDNKSFAVHEKSLKEAYSIVIPPPNVTGKLHIGHALNNTVQDILIRYKRMSGYEALWMPGTDHAGIATQNVVERKLANEGEDRHVYGREKFIKIVWEWKKDYHSCITNQLKKLGTSCDWDRERFTMDQGLSNAVKKVFLSLYNDGLIYRGKYIINWCPRCKTALSDEEAEHEEIAGKLWYFKYPFASSQEGYISVATTRPETMLGDTAVAVNPSDIRFKEFIGKKVKLPLTDREIPIIGDDFVSKDFGTGAVKVTPAHDPNDFQIGMRHSMEPIVVMDENGKMCGAIAEKYKNRDRFECRELIIKDMTQEGLIEKTEDHTHAVGHCYRCHTVVEPYYSDQWFVKMKPLVKEALKAAKDDKISFYPTRWKRTYIEWMENIRDWCISRQIWWGHRIPIWYCNQCNGIIASENTPKKCEKCNSHSLHQDEDVLDTWFSSWLWPFSTMGWPEKTNVMDKFYPTNTLVTAPEILFFWVARMIMAGLYCTSKLPFTDILLHGTVRDKKGRKMSKSLGNTIDPIEIINQYGADALRFSMIMITAQGADVFLEKDTFDIGRNFANKLWNASRFFLGNIDNKMLFNELPAKERLKTEDVWILSRYNRTVKEVIVSLDNYRLNDVCHVLYDFIWHDFCDWYIESKKLDLYQGSKGVERDKALNLCGFLLAGILKLLHPVMPFITEEIWAHLNRKIDYPLCIDQELIINSLFPRENSCYIDEELENKFNILQEIIISLRTIRSENNVPPDKQGKVIIIPVDEAQANWLTKETNLINLFANIQTTIIDIHAKKPSFAGHGVVRGIQIILELEGLIKKDIEIERIKKEIAHLQKIADGARKRLANENFLRKAPEDVVTRENEKFTNIINNIEKLTKNLHSIKTS